VIGGKRHKNRPASLSAERICVRLIADTLPLIRNELEGELSMQHVTCHICACENEVPNERDSSCAMCDADLADSQSEVKLLEDTHAALYNTVDKFTAPGWEAFIYLTNKRLLVIPAKLKGSGLQGRLSAAVYNKMAGESDIISIPLANIKAVREGKFGLLMKALIIDTTDGGLLKIKVSKRNEWKDTIAKAAK